MENEEEFENFMEVEVEGIFIKHDFDHIILHEDEVEKYTNRNLTYSTMKQTLFVEYQYDIQVLLYFLHAHFPSVKTQMGQDEIEATLIESGEKKAPKKGPKYDVKIIIDKTHANDGIILKYYYSAQKLKVEWITSP